MNTKKRSLNVVYQIYPRSFRDSNGDGVGDIPGVIEKIDYLKWLGVDTVWFNPFFTSPQKDLGYDISNFTDISPEYGTMGDFDLMLEELHRQGIKVILDLVLNHTSVEHPWFKESASSRDNPRREWYIWRDGKKPGGKKPPNNWRAATGGPAWKYFANTDQWVYFHFLPFEVDLNYRNLEVKNTMLNVMRFWLNKGVDGFRLDFLHAIYEDEELRNNPFSWRLFPSDKSVAMLFDSHKYDLNLPDTIAFARELREVVDEYQPRRFLVGEVFGDIEQTCQYCGPENTGLNMVFLFEFTSTAFKPRRYARIIRRIEECFPSPNTPTYVFSNHDRVRFITRLSNNEEKVKLAATMQMTLRGVPFIYYGEEIGIPNVNFKLKNSQDPIGKKYAWSPISQIPGVGFSLSRDGCRTPMQWTDGPNAGFCKDGVEPWLKISNSYRKKNVAAEMKMSHSLLNIYRSLIRLRKTVPAIAIGGFEFIDLSGQDKRCLAYRRYYEDNEIHVYLNFSRKKVKFTPVLPIGNYHILFSTRDRNNELSEDGKNIELGSYEGIVLDTVEGKESDL